MPDEPILWTSPLICAALIEHGKALNPPRKLETPYGMAKFLSADPNTCNDWMIGRRTMSEKWVEKVAPMIGQDPAWLNICLGVERTKSAKMSQKMRAILLGIPNRVAVIFVGFCGLFLSLAGQVGIT